MKKYAFFDFDNTVYGGYSYDDFVSHVCSNILKDDYLYKKFKSSLKVSTDYNDLVNRLASVVGETVKGWTVEDFERETKVACSKKKVLDWVKPVTDFLKSEGFETIIISASFKEMIDDSQEVLKMDKVYYSKLELVDQKYSGNVEFLLNDKQKEKTINELTSRGSTYSVAFGDSMGDAEMLDAVDLPFLVRSYDKRTEDAAKNRGWVLGYEPKDIIGNIKKQLESNKF